MFENIQSKQKLLLVKEHLEANLPRFTNHSPAKYIVRINLSECQAAITCNSYEELQALLTGYIEELEKELEDV